MITVFNKVAQPRPNHLTPEPQRPQGMPATRHPAQNELASHSTRRRRPSGGAARTTDGAAVRSKPALSFGRFAAGYFFVVVDGGAPLPGGGVHPAKAATEKTTRQHTINIRRIIGPAPPISHRKENYEKHILIPRALALKGREIPPRQARQASAIGNRGQNRSANPKQSTVACSQRNTATSAVRIDAARLIRNTGCVNQDDLNNQSGNERVQQVKKSIASDRRGTPRIEAPRRRPAFDRQGRKTFCFRA